jgi:hypothetical protein
MIGIGIGNNNYSIMNRGVIDSQTHGPQPDLAINVKPVVWNSVHDTSKFYATGGELILPEIYDEPPEYPEIRGFCQFDGIDNWLRVPNDASINGDTLSGGFVAITSVLIGALGVVNPIFWKDGEYECYIDASNKIIFKVYDAEGDWIQAELDAAVVTTNSWASIVCVFTGSAVEVYSYVNQTHNTAYTETSSGVFGTLTDASNDLYFGYNGSDYYTGGLLGVGIIGEDLDGYGTGYQTILLDNLLFAMILENGNLAFWESVYEQIAGIPCTTTQLWCPLITDFIDQTGNNIVGV